MFRWHLNIWLTPEYWNKLEQGIGPRKTFFFIENIYSSDSILLKQWYTQTLSPYHVHPEIISSLRLFVPRLVRPGLFFFMCVFVFVLSFVISAPMTNATPAVRPGLFFMCLFLFYHFLDRLPWRMLHQRFQRFDTLSYRWGQYKLWEGNKPCQNDYSTNSVERYWLC